MKRILDELERLACAALDDHSPDYQRGLGRAIATVRQMSVNRVYVASQRSSHNDIVAVGVFLDPGDARRAVTDSGKVQELPISDTFEAWRKTQAEPPPRTRDELRRSALSKLTEDEIGALEVGSKPSRTPRDWVDRRVRVTQLTDRDSRGWASGARTYAKVGERGVVRDCSTGHGTCFEVYHDSGSRAWYHEEELELLQ